MKPPQKTIRAPVDRTGVGVNTGNRVAVRVRPADADAGIAFVRTDLPGAPAIPVEPASVANEPRRTVLRRDGAEVQMTEHLLAAVAGLGLDNLVVEVDGPELPVGDGSARHFVEMLQEAGTVEQDRPRRTLTLRKPISVADGSATVVALPAAEGLTLAYTLDYDDASIPTQHVELALTPDSFIADLAPARTFVFEREAQALLDAGFGRAASYHNTLVVRPDGSVVDNQLRFPDEFARHKALDLLGDLTLAGTGLVARIVAVKSGHLQNVRLAELLFNHAVPSDAVSLDVRDILSVVPHRYPFLLVDRVVRIVPGRRAVAVKNVTINEPFFAGHFPGTPVMPGVLIVEAMAQAAGLLFYHQCADAGTLAHLAAIDRARFRKPVVPGDQLRIEVETLRQRGRTHRVAARTLVDGQLAAEATITFFVVPTPPNL